MILKKTNIKKLTKTRYKVANIYIKKTLNNIFITLTNLKGDTIKYYSTGKVEKKSTNKSSTYVAEVMIKKILNDCSDVGIRYVCLYYSGIIYNLKSYLKEIKKKRIHVLSLTNNTPINYNGCKAPKPRRL